MTKRPNPLFELDPPYTGGLTIDELVVHPDYAGRLTAYLDEIIKQRRKIEDEKEHLDVLFAQCKGYWGLSVSDINAHIKENY